MALPASFNTVSVHAQAYMLSGAPAQGTVEFVMTQIVTVPGAKAIIYPTAIVGTYDVNGAFTVTLPCGDDPDVDQQFLYTVTEKPANSTGRTYPILISTTMIGTTQELALLSPAGPVDLALAYLTKAVADQLYQPLGQAGPQTLDTEAVQDLVAAMFAAPGSGISIVYDDVNGTLTPSVTGREPSITAGTTSQYWRGDKTWQTLNATAVGLGSVNNTSDLAKPISTATQTALNAKQDTLTFANVLSGATYTIQKDPVTGFWPTSYSATGVPGYTGGTTSTGLRPTSRADVFFQWKGPDPSPPVVTTGTGGMLSGTDTRQVTT